MKEVIRTSGDIRRTLAQTMVDIRCGDLSVDKGLAVAAVAKEITASLQVEVNIAKTRLTMMHVGLSIGDITQMGKLVIEEEESTPTLNGFEPE